MRQRRGWFVRRVNEPVRPIGDGVGHTGEIVVDSVRVCLGGEHMTLRSPTEIDRMLPEIFAFGRRWQEGVSTRGDRMVHN
jgi:hypothetical protein